MLVDFRRAEDSLWSINFISDNELSGGVDAAMAGVLGFRPRLRFAGLGSTSWKYKHVP